MLGCILAQLRAICIGAEDEVKEEEKEEGGADGRSACESDQLVLPTSAI